MPWGLKRFQEARCLHFLTFSCYNRAPRLGAPQYHVFEQTFEETRKWYGFYVAGYVVMPEHVHLLMSEPERAKLSIALQMLNRTWRGASTRAGGRSILATALLRFQLVERGQAGREVALHASQSGEARSGGESGGLGVEQFSSLRVRS